MTLRNRVTLRDKANFLFASIRNTSTSADGLRQLFQAAVHHSPGIAVFESWHGTYAFPLLLKELMPDLAAQGVTRFYVEMIPSEKQHLVDQWQQGGDDRGLVDYFDSRHVGYSRGMWQHYWMMLQAADENGIRIVGIDKPSMQKSEEGRRLYSPVFLAPFKNMHFEDVIREDLQDCGPGEKFVVYAGENHGTDYGGVLVGIHERLGIPRFILNQGDYAYARHPFSDIPSFSVFVPPAPHQDHREKRPVVRTNPVRWPV